MVCHVRQIAEWSLALGIVRSDLRYADCCRHCEFFGYGDGLRKPGTDGIRIDFDCGCASACATISDRFVDAALWDERDGLLAGFTGERRNAWVYVVDHFRKFAGWIDSYRRCDLWYADGERNFQFHRDGD